MEKGSSEIDKALHELDSMLEKKMNPEVDRALYELDSVLIEKLKPHYKSLSNAFVRLTTAEVIQQIIDSIRKVYPNTAMCEGFDAYEREKKIIERENEDLKNKASSLENINKTYENRINTLEEENKNLHKTVKSLEKEVVILKKNYRDDITIEDIKRLKGKGWSDQAIADKYGVSRQTIINRLKKEKNGNKNPTEDT